MRGCAPVRYAVRRRASTAVRALLALVLLLAAAGLPDSAKSAEPAPTKAEEPIVVGSEIDFPPYALVDSEGNADGFSVELFKAVAAAMDIPVRFRTGEWSTIWNALKSGEIAALPLVATSRERADLVGLTIPHTTTFDAFFVRRGERALSSLAEADGKEIIVMRGDAAHEELQRRGFRGRIVTTATIPEAMRLLASGKHDAVLVSKLIGHMVLGTVKLGGVVSAGSPLDEYRREFAFAVPKSDEALRTRLEQGIAIVKATGRYEAIYRKWLRPLEPRRVDLRTLAWWVGGLSALALFLAAWSLSLRREVRLRRRQEQALSESQDRLASIVNSAMDAIISVDDEHRIHLFNPAAERMFLVGADACLGRPLSQFIPAASRHRHEDNMRAFAATGITARRMGSMGRYSAVRANGENFLVEVSISQGTVAGRHMFNAIVRDVTELERSEQALRWNARRDELLSATAARLLRSTSPQSRIDELCREVMDFLRCDVFFNFLADEEAQRLRLNAYAGIPARDAHRLDNLDYGTAVCGCVARDREHITAQNILASNDPRTELLKSYGVEACCCQPLIVQDRLIGTLSFGTRARSSFSADEISVMKTVADLVAMALYRIESERTLRESEERLRLALSATSTAMWDWHVRTGKTYWSPEHYTMLGYAAHAIEPNYSNWARQVHPDDLAGVEAALQASMREHREYHHEFRVVLPGSGVRWMEARASYSYAADGTCERMLGVMNDVTERKAREQQVALLLKEVNHRAKNLLGVVQAVAWQTAAREPADFVERFSQRLHSLAASQDLLVRSQWQGVEVGELVRSQLAHLADLIGTRIKIDGPPLRLTAKTAQSIGMALHELATNAGKYGAFANGAGAVSVCWHCAPGTGGDVFTLSWVERGGPPVLPPSRRGFGTTVIQAMPQVELEAEVTLDYAPEGLNWRITCAADRVLEPAPAEASPGLIGGP